ncbi:uncharacterized protein LOC123258235 [Drosophila ananassae]|uniref:uncharacterized protein LOC123258226 n=1 Tax=Drosophila ananassae TaxID=7217 RepID=UPI001CFF7264|nr:uncharacterized protein LOC123258226 [Drosophila ananassae]XP_044574044.1 uncharacterized protein LOC123258235 [Drosophila ananassae]
MEAKQSSQPSPHASPVVSSDESDLEILDLPGWDVRRLQSTRRVLRVMARGANGVTAIPVGKARTEEKPGSPRDLTALTPGHFLIGEPLTASPDIHQSRRRTGLLTRLKRIEQLRKEFWTRWSHEYLHELQNRSKWPRSCKTVKIGDLVIIKEDNIAPLNWPLGRIVAVHPGKDGEIRVAEIRTTFGNITRAIHRLAVLPINDKKEEPDL